jgi:uncharacterized integral membrane protein
MAEESRTDNLLQALMRRSRLPWYWATAVVTALLLLLLILAACLDGAFSDLSELQFWQRFMDSPVIIIYILLVYPFIWRLWQRAVRAFQPLLPLNDNASNQIAVEVTTQNRRWEWVALLIGVVFFISIDQPWGWRPVTGEIWLHVYELVTFALLFGFLSWLIYNGLADSRYLARLNRQNLNLDIFEPGLLAPVAHWSLGTSLAFIGGISLSLVFQTREHLLNWQNITIYSVLVGAVVMLFFMSMWSTHQAMERARNRELALARKHLTAAYRELKERVAQNQMEGVEKLYSTLTAWSTYERQGKEAPTWPFNAGVIRRLAISGLLPGLIYLIRYLIGPRLGL